MIDGLAFIPRRLFYFIIFSLWLVSLLTGWSNWTANRWTRWPELARVSHLDIHARVRMRRKSLWILVKIFFLLLLLFYFFLLHPRTILGGWRHYKNPQKENLWYQTASPPVSFFLSILLCFENVDILLHSFLLRFFCCCFCCPFLVFQSKKFCFHCPRELEKKLLFPSSLPAGLR